MLVLIFLGYRTIPTSAVWRRIKFRTHTRSSPLVYKDYIVQTEAQLVETQIAHYVSKSLRHIWLLVPTLMIVLPYVTFGIAIVLSPERSQCR